MSLNFKLFFFGFFVLILVWSYWETTPKRVAKEHQEIAACEKPQLVGSTSDGVHLWSIKPGCGNPIYFSSAGTNWRTFEMHGKVNEPVDHEVPNSNSF